nr:MAG TPA: hypothetical protein [Caudoviricetes sp.]
MTLCIKHSHIFSTYLLCFRMFSSFFIVFIQAILAKV